MNVDGRTTLPLFRRWSNVGAVNAAPAWLLVVVGICAYATVVFGATFIEISCISSGQQIVKEDGQLVTDFWDIAYFNLVTVLTVGYGDLTPVGVGRLIAVVEAFLGVGLLGTFLGVLVVRFMLPRNNAIVFARRCFYDLQEKRFVIVFVNTMDLVMVNAEMCSLVKVGRADWVVKPSYMSPYIGESAWTFSIDGLDPASLREKHIYPDDGVKFGITGSFGYAKYSAAMKYNFDKVIVINTKQELPLEVLRKGEISSDQFRSEFERLSLGSGTFLDYAKNMGAIVEDR